MKLNTMKMVGITEKAHEALDELRTRAMKSGISLSKGAIASQLILAAKLEDICPVQKR